MDLNLLQKSGNWDRFGSLFKQEIVKAKTVLLEEGEVCKKAYFVEKGCLRFWFKNDGKDISFQFFFEGDFILCIESFKTGQPSLYALESIEPSTLRTVSKEDFEFIIENSAEIKIGIEELTIQWFLFYQKLFISRIKDNPEKRYQEILHQQPKIAKRVPLNHIASYLGITAVSLSRIRNRR
ncbi:Crp/Fnr family transcriptional regulator [Flavobacterium sp. FlaQc-48]|uniref:Crp/Fnr family transcriptional regulator n=1 Tax=Flavobacterium sp. FlaQc-48 TaxID=3374181 RepID=UPI00375687C6